MNAQFRAPSALIVVVVLAGACGSGEIGAGDRAYESPGARSGQPATGADGGIDAEVIVPPPGDEDSSDRPWAHNTGPSDPGALEPSGSLIITTDGAALENLEITGVIQIEADNVTIRNFRINATASYGIDIASGHDGILLEDGEIYGMDSAAILGAGFTARRLHIHDSEGDGLKVGGSGGPTLVEYSFIEKLGRKVDSHADGNQTRGGSNITFRYNNIYMPVSGTPEYPGSPYKSNATFMLQLNISNFVIENNWLTGGNYTIYCPDNGGVSVRNNRFGRDYRFGPINGPCDEKVGNVWDDTGDPI